MLEKLVKDRSTEMLQIGATIRRLNYSWSLAGKMYLTAYNVLSTKKLEPQM